MPSHTPEEQIKRLQEDPTLATSGNIGRTPGGFVNTITGEMLQPVTPVNFQTPATPTLSVPKADDFTPLEPTPQETDISKKIKSVTGEGTALAGEVATFRAEEEKRLGLEALKLGESDLFSKLKQQQAEFENLQAEDTRIQERLQQESLGRGITRGGLASLEASELRKNFLIKSEKAAQVNVTTALLAATQNKFLTAQSLIDRAIKNKYGVRQAILEAETNNLNLFLKDPTLDVAQKNRAEARLAKKEKEKRELDKKEADSKKILEWSVDAKKNGATPQQAQAIADIGASDNPDLAKAFELYSPFAQPKATTTGDIAEFKQFFPNVDLTTPAGQQQYLDWQAREAAAGRTTPTSEARDTTISQYLEGKKGTDGYVSASSYQEGLRKFIANGGTQTNFLASFPQQTYLKQDEIEKLPASLRTAQVAPLKTLSADQQTMLNEAKTTWDAAKQTYQATPELRQKIIDRAKGLGFDLSPYF